MRTQWGIFLVLAIGVAALIFTASGYGGQYANDPSAGLGPIGDDVERQANESSVKGGGIEGSASGTDQPLINFILSGGGALLSTAKLVVSLPLALESLGLPAWFAYPVGSLVTLGTSFGVIQFIAGRVYR